MPRLVAMLALAACAAIAFGQSISSIGSNDVVTGTISAMESTHAYLLDLPPGIEHLVIDVDGGDRDADLAVYFGAEERFRDTSSDTAASYSLASPSAGQYRIEVLNLLFQELHYTLTVSAQSRRAPDREATAGPIQGDIRLGEARRGVAPASRSGHTYDLGVPSGTHAFTVRVDAGGRDVDLSVTFGGREIFRDVSTNPYPVFRLPDPAAGTYALTVVSPLGREVPYVLSVESPGAPTTTRPPSPERPSDAPATAPSPGAPGDTAAPAGPSASAWRHDFASGETLGWTLENGSLSNPGGGGPGGGGYLYADTPSDRAVGYFVAPTELLGDWSSLSSLTLVLRHGPQYEGELFGPYEYDGVGDVVLANGAKTASYAFPRAPTRAWSPHDVSLVDATGWRLGGGATSLAEVLADVTSFAVRAEYLVGHADAGMASVEAFRGGSLGGAMMEPTVTATCTTTAEDGAIGDLAPGSRIHVACPAGCTDGGTVWGHGTYTDDSAICRAAVHAGVQDGAYPGSVLIRILGSRDSYVGAERNGVSSRSYGSWPRSFAFGEGFDLRDGAR
ncbi:MAG: LCCL domain-containing protein [Trueperaceae bacterium]|nr:LCCL domain-containing protein [Trueperaceae bacterium]